MANKLFVGNLPFGLKDEELKELFAGAGAGNIVSATVVTDKFTGKSRGFGFVEYSSEDEAKKAVAALNGTEVQGRNLTVNEARPLTPGGGGRRNFGGGRPRRDGRGFNSDSDGN